MNFFENTDYVSPYGLRLSDLNVDEAYLNLTSVIYDRLGVYSLSSDCKKCPFAYVTSLKTSKVLTVSTKYRTKWRFYNESLSTPTKPVSDAESLVCEFDEDIEEFGIYDVAVRKGYYKFATQKDPANIYLPLCATLISLLLLYLFVKLAWNLSERYFIRKRNVADEVQLDDDGKPVKIYRIRSIDAFRGFALCFMIFVNDGGGQYWFFNHSTWDGLYPADVLFPWFLWIMGVCIALSQTSLRKRMVKKRTIFVNILQRTFILFMIGLSLNTLGVGPIKIVNLRVPGVLQRIAISYGFTSIIAMLVYDINVKWLSMIKHITMILPQWFLHLSVLTVHVYLTFYLPIPGCPLGYLGPGGIQDEGKYENCTGGATGYVDKLILGEARLWQNAPVRTTYHTLPFDSENILGCLTSIFGTFLGVQAGYILVVHQKPIARIRHLITWAIISLSIGFGLHFFQVVPLNKNLWSLSFVFVTGGLAYLFFAIFYYIIDFARLWDGSPFVYPGMNSILVYVGHEICFQLFPWHWKISTMNTHSVNLIENAWGVILWIVITFCLYKKKIFVTV